MHKRRDLDEARAQHDSAPDPEFYVQSRAEDNSLLWRGAYLLQKFAILWIPTAWVVSAVGFGIGTPKGKVEKIQVQVDSVQMATRALHDTLNAVRGDVAAIVMLNCLDPKIPPQYKILARLRCP